MNFVCKGKLCKYYYHANFPITTFYFGFSVFTFFQIEKLYMDCWTISFSFKIFHLHSAPYSDGISPSLVWPQWWSFADVSQQGLHFSKTISKWNIIFWFDFQRCSHGLSKSAYIWLSKSIFYVKNHLNLSDFFFIEEYPFRRRFFVIVIFWKLQFLNHFVF